MLPAVKCEMVYKGSRRFWNNKFKKSMDLIPVEVVLIVQILGKIKQFLYKPREVLRVLGSKNWKKSANRSSKFVSPTQQTLLHPWNISGTHFC